MDIIWLAPKPVIQPVQPARSAIQTAQLPVPISRRLCD
jgi:hypothetical protein